MTNRNTTPAARVAEAMQEALRTADLGDVEVEIATTEDRVLSVEAIWNHGKTGQGNGSRALRILTEACDREGVTLEGHVHPLRHDLENGSMAETGDVDALHRLNETYLDGPALLAWYSRHGFVAADTPPGEDVHVTRRPAMPAQTA